MFQFVLTLCLPLIHLPIKFRNIDGVGVKQRFDYFEKTEKRFYYIFYKLQLTYYYYDF